MGCASIGMPQGGPKDETPPVMLGSKPEANARNWDKKKIELYFDELVNVQKASENVVVSPPQKKPPTVSNIMRKIVVELQDSLQADQTYTIDFGDAIVDYNEANPFGRYVFAFSTGDSLDSLGISGTVLNAATLAPEKGIIVGVHADMGDSAFYNEPFLRIGKTNEKGRFYIHNLKPVAYKVYALGDQNRDYRFDQKGEGLAFMDSVVVPWMDFCPVNDTIWRDSLTIDSIVVRQEPCYKPDDLILRYYNEDFGRQYLVKAERPERNKIGLTFGFKADSLPRLTLLTADSLRPADDWLVLEDNPTHDTLTYWIKDSVFIKTDTLHLQLDYLKTDSADRLVAACDTLHLIAKKEKAASSKSTRKNERNSRDKKNNRQGGDEPAVQANRQDTVFKTDTIISLRYDSLLATNVADTLLRIDTIVPPPPVKPVKHFNMEAKMPATMEVFGAPYFVWEHPIAEIQGQPWHLFFKKDTSWVEIREFDLTRDDYNPRIQHLYADWDYEVEYKLALDSGTVRSIYDSLTNNTYTKTFKVRAEKEYSRLMVEIAGLDGHSAFVEVLDKSEKVLRREDVVGGIADCLNMKPGEYYLRLILDEDEDFQWTTGCFEAKRQPEQVFYLNKKISLRANWEVNENWNIRELPIEAQKPEELQPKTTEKKGR